MTEDNRGYPGYPEEALEDESIAGRLGEALRGRAASALNAMVAARNHGDHEESLRRLRAIRSLEARISAVVEAIGGDRTPAGRMMRAAVASQNNHLVLLLKETKQVEDMIERRKNEANALDQEIDRLREVAANIRGKNQKITTLRDLVLYQDRRLRVQQQYTDALVKLGDLRREMWTVHRETASLVEEYALKAEASFLHSSESAATARQIMAPAHNGAQQGQGGASTTDDGGRRVTDNAPDESQLEAELNPFYRKLGVSDDPHVTQGARSGEAPLRAVQ